MIRMHADFTGRSICTCLRIAAPGLVCVVFRNCAHEHSLHETRLSGGYWTLFPPLHVEVHADIGGWKKEPPHLHFGWHSSDVRVPRVKGRRSASEKRELTSWPCRSQVKSSQSQPDPFPVGAYACACVSVCRVTTF